MGSGWPSDYTEDQPQDRPKGWPPNRTKGQAYWTGQRIGIWSELWIVPDRQLFAFCMGGSPEGLLLALPPRTVFEEVLAGLDLVLEPPALCIWLLVVHWRCWPVRQCPAFSWSLVGSSHGWVQLLLLAESVSSVLGPDEVRLGPRRASVHFVSKDSRLPRWASDLGGMRLCP